MTLFEPTSSPVAGVDRVAGARHSTLPQGAPLVPGYLVSELVGRGGTGTVWAATRESDGLQLALKVIPLEDADEAAAMREVDVLRGAKLDHLVQLHEVHRVGGDLVLVLDLLHGGSLASVLAARGYLSAGECVTVLTPLLTAIGRLHRMGVVHGDISPGNVLFDLEGRPFLGDLGEARLAGHDVDDPGATPGFAAPEVLIGGPAAPAADVHSIGALGIYCLTGSAPQSRLVGTTTASAAPSAPLLDPAAQKLLRLCEGAIAPTPQDRPDPDELSAAIFATTEATALRLVLAADPAAALTRRMRELARPSKEVEASTPVPIRFRRRMRLPRQRVPGAQESRVGRQRARPLDPRSAGSLLVAAALALALVGVLVAAVVSLKGDVGTGPRARVSADSATESVAGRRASAVQEAAASMTEVPGPAEGPPAPRAGTSPSPSDSGESAAEVRLIVANLAQTRAALWGDPEGADLSLLDVAGSPAAERDRAELQRRVAGGVTLEGLQLKPARVELIRSGGGELTAHVELSASAHRQVSRQGVKEVEELRATPVLLDLRRTEAGWRVWDVRTP